MTINQALPGPAINVCKGDRIIVDVINHMPGRGLTIHWHGQDQKKTPWYDGATMVTQCPHAYGTFRYIFTASHAGTSIYYSHTGLDRSNGLVGKLIVRDANDPHAKADRYDYDLAEHEILITDWTNRMIESHEFDLRNGVTTPESILINGFGNYLDPETEEYASANHPIAVFYVERSRKHRFRFANAGSYNCPFEISIRDHKLLILATDGSPIEPIEVDSIVAYPGERFDAVMDATTVPEISAFY